MTLPDGDLLATQTELGITVSLVPSNDPCCGGTPSGTIAAMAWVKIPVDNHPVFLAAVPKDPRVTTLRMFGGLAAKANGYMFGGLFARAAFVRLSPADQRTALALDGAEPFDPMGNGRVMSNMIMLPEAVMEEPAELRDWLARALAHTAGLPAKPHKPKLRAATKPRKPKQPKRAAAKPGDPKRAARAATKPGQPKRAAAKPGKSKQPKRAAAKPGKPKRAAAKPGK
jgi:TfoX/Sxy family transcriptional regulator of competence genes